MRNTDLSLFVVVLSSVESTSWNFRQHCHSYTVHNCELRRKSFEPALLNFLFWFADGISTTICFRRAPRHFKIHYCGCCVMYIISHVLYSIHCESFFLIITDVCWDHQILRKTLPVYFLWNISLFFDLNLFEQCVVVRWWLHFSCVLFSHFLPSMWVK
jgi:hypothetical protein